MNVSVSLHSTDKEPTVYPVVAPDGAFIVVNIGGLSIYLAGFEAECVANARALAAELTRVADEVAATLPAEQENAHVR